MQKNLTRLTSCRPFTYSLSSFTANDRGFFFFIAIHKNEEHLFPFFWGGPIYGGAFLAQFPILKFYFLTITLACYYVIWSIFFPFASFSLDCEMETFQMESWRRDGETKPSSCMHFGFMQCPGRFRGVGEGIHTPNHTHTYTHTDLGWRLSLTSFTPEQWSLLAPVDLYSVHLIRFQISIDRAQALEIVLSSAPPRSYLARIHHLI